MGFETKHKMRDLNIPKVRQKLMEAIESDFLQDPNVLAIFYGGSIGTGSTDLYSDIDLRLVIKDEVFEEYRLNKKKRAEEWGDVLFYEDFPWTSHSVAHFRGFVKVDSFYYKKEDLLPSIWFKDIKIVHDTNDFMKNIKRESAGLEYVPSVGEIEIWRNKFLAYTQEVYRGVMRKEYYYALSCLDSLRLFIANGWLMEAGLHPNNPGYWAKLEGERSRLQGWQKDLLVSWNSDRNPDQIMQSLKGMVPEFLRLHQVLSNKFCLKEENENLDEVLAMFL